MSRPIPLVSSPNRLLSAMAPDELAYLRPHLAAHRFDVGFSFARPDEPIAHVHFVESGMASVVASDGRERSAETGLIGREGFTGMSVALESGQSPHHCFAQHAGTSLRVGAAALRDAMEASPALRRLLLNYVHVMMVQSAETSLANARANLEQRLARWLLMAQDRLDNDTVTLTHQFLSTMLGVRRAGVTIALQELESRGVVRGQRGRISVVDRGGLETIAGRIYGVPEAEYRRLIG